MKCNKIIAGLLACTIATGTLPLGITAAAEEADTAPVYTLGDITGDGHIDTVDAIRILKHYAESILDHAPVLSDAQMTAADLNGDARVNVSDAILVLGYYASSILGNTQPIAEYVEWKLHPPVIVPEEPPAEEPTEGEEIPGTEPEAPALAE